MASSEHRRARLVVHREDRQGPVKILICALEAAEHRVNGFRLAVGALLDEFRKHHDVRCIAYRMPDQGSLSDSRELRLLAPPSRRVRGSTLMIATVRRRPWG